MTRFERFPKGRGFEELTVEGVSGIHPTRGTRESAGYDFYLPEDVSIRPGETKIVKTHVTAYMHDNEFLDLRLRSSLSLRGLIELNGCGVIDADYHGHDIGFILHNISDQVIEMKKGDRIGQGIFMQYELADRDMVMSEERTGGFGSTNS